MKLTNCTCGKKLNCGCTMSFDTYEANSVSRLTVGNLLGGTCIFDEYVIDWYLNGSKVLTTGKGNDPDITAQHPLTGEAALPVVAGTYQPIVRYVVMDGKIIYPAKRSCANYCEALGTQLPEIKVAAIDCGTVNTTGDYSYYLSYNVEQDYALASREVLFMLPADLGAKYLAVYFYAYTVADKVEVLFNDETILASWIIGSQNNPAQYTTMPYCRSGYDHDFIILLPEYQAGDYLKIKVTPSVKKTNINTLWRLRLKCLDQDPECDLYTTAMQTIDLDTIEMVDVPASCRLEMRFKTLEPIPYLPPLIIKKYGGYGYLGHSRGSFDYNGARDNGYVLFLYGYQSKISLFSTSVSAWVASQGVCSLQKSGNVVTITCNNSSDYNKFKNTWNTSSGVLTKFNPDPSTPEYASAFYLKWHTSMISCGDTFIDRFMTISCESVFTFDDVNYTVTIQLAQAQASTYTPISSCDSTKTGIDGVINAINQTYNAADFNDSTVCIADIPFYAYWRFRGIVSEAENAGGYGVFQYGDKSVPCVMQNFVLLPSTLHHEFLIFYLNVKITDTRDPINNFEVWNRSVNGIPVNYPYTGQTLIYKMENGVRVI